VGRTRYQPKIVISQDRGETISLEVITGEEDTAVPYPSQDRVKWGWSENPSDHEVDRHDYRESRESADPVKVVHNTHTQQDVVPQSYVETHMCDRPIVDV